MLFLLVFLDAHQAADGWSTLFLLLFVWTIPVASLGSPQAI